MVLALSIVSVAASAQADSTWRDHERALQAARNADDTVSYRAQLNAIYGAIGATPRIATRYAALAVEARDSAGASHWMGALAAMGNELDTGMVSRYGALAGAGAAISLRAAHAFATRGIGAPALVARLPYADMISEDLAYDEKRGRVLVSSVHRGGIYSIANGRTTTLVEPGADGTWGMFALGVDSARGSLWATTAALPIAAGYSPADSGRSALIEYDLRTGARRARFVAPDSGAHVLGDLVVGSSGAVYVSDGLGGGVYALAPRGDSLRVLVPRGTFSSPQTPALSSDGATLFVPDYSVGIAAVDIASGSVTWLTHSDSLALVGIDGMYRVGQELIAVQNGLEPNRIMRLTLDPPMRRVVRAVAVARGPGAPSLTHATVSGGWLYLIAKSGWERAADDGTMTAAASATDAPEIVRVRIAP
jgi:outer membrane protein assembly factor BamB